jgi:hypothetical protein
MRKQSWPIPWYYPGIFFKGLRDFIKNSHLQDYILTRELPKYEER